MKTNNLLTGLILALFIMNISCVNEPDPQVWEYQSVVFTFQDASGKDLVREVVEPLIDYEELTLPEKFYSLKVNYPQPCMDPVEAALERCRKSESCVELTSITCTPIFYIDLVNEQEFWEIFFKPETSDQCAKTNMLTLVIKSPIFGDDTEHEIVLHFDGLKVSRIQMDDKECSFIQKTIIDHGSWAKRITYKPEKAVIAFCSIVL